MSFHARSPTAQQYERYACLYYIRAIVRHIEAADGACEPRRELFGNQTCHLADTAIAGMLPGMCLESRDMYSIGYPACCTALLTFTFCLPRQLHYQYVGCRSSAANALSHRCSSSRLQCIWYPCTLRDLVAKRVPDLSQLLI